MTAKVIIFDFDGTIADTFEPLVQIANQLATEFNYPLITPQRIAELRVLSSWEIVQQAGIPLVRLPFFLKRVQVELADNIKNLQPIANITPALWELKRSGLELGILTSNHKANVQFFLANHGLETAFNFIYSGTSLFSKHKVLKKILRKYHYTPEQVIYVGDETRDLVAAQKCQIQTIAVAWGFNCATVLAQHQPDCLVKCPQDLVAAVQQLISGKPSVSDSPTAPCSKSFQGHPIASAHS